eukprot:TRINITY_DN3766_c1_g1_i2.p1 TRINITY_DN3766_c1_g1~~TRINITY_DN3766_c1_g1_i2.p1  ORF type:complete len:114 (-),score=27.90 TRINITY_DN3766_c1_g1_i2:997-1338(-)
MRSAAFICNKRCSADGVNYHQGPRAAAAAAAGAAVATTALLRHYEQCGRFTEFLTITANLPAFNTTDSTGGIANSSADSSAPPLPWSDGEVPALVEVATISFQTSTQTSTWMP